MSLYNFGYVIRRESSEAVMEINLEVKRFFSVQKCGYMELRKIRKEVIEISDVQNSWNSFSGIFLRS